MSISDTLFEVGENMRSAKEWYFDTTDSTWNYSDDVKARYNRIHDEVKALQGDLDDPRSGVPNPAMYDLVDEDEDGVPLHIDTEVTPAE